MVYWITGKKDSGKTTYAYNLKDTLELNGELTIILDGDEIRSQFPIEYCELIRQKRTYNIAKLAVIFEKQGVIPIISLLSEKREWRVQCRAKFQESKLIYLPGGFCPEGVIYEEPDEKELL